MVADCTEPTVVTVATASNVAEQLELPGMSLACCRGTFFTFITRGLGRHRSQPPEDVHTCGFRVSAAERTLSSIYCASLGLDCL